MSSHGVLDVVKRVRDCVNNPWKKQDLLSNRKNWHMICACLDVIEDSQFAIEYFYALPDFSANSGGYLYLYGLLQAFFVQQDALSNLSQSVCGNSIDWKGNFPEIYSIRELRNDAIGHPTNRGGKSFHFLSGQTINKASFEMASYCEEANYRFDPRRVDLNTLRQTQERIIVSLLNGIEEKMNKEMEEHKSTFKGKTLVSLIPKSFGYSLSKVYEGISSNYALAELCYNELETCYTNIKDGIAERYGSIDTLSGVEIVTSKLDYIVQRLKAWITAGELYNNKDAEVFLDGFKHGFDDLREIIEEIDNEFDN